MRHPLLLLVLVVACGFPEPPTHDAGDDEPPPPCTTCFLLAVEPAIATTGDTIVLHGAFAPGATVVFPGGATAPATLQGPHRATAVVPAGATTGALTVSGAAGEVRFRHTSFALGVQTFQLHDDQTNGARLTPSLVVPRRAAATAVVGDAVYIFGGVDAGEGFTTRVDVERAPILADGSLGPFAIVPGVTLTKARWYASAVVLGGFVYVVGGNTTGDVDLDPASTVERAPIRADGTLGTFEVAPNTGLVTPRHLHHLAVIGDRLYAVGGASNGSNLTSVEHAPIAPDGTLGPFVVDATTLVKPHVYGGGAVTGAHYYIFGGEDGTGVTAAIERAPIGEDGSLGPFEPAGTLLQPRSGFSAFRAGRALVVAGGNASGTSEAAMVAPDGTLGAFAPAAALPVAAGCAMSAIAGDFAYLIGGCPSGASLSTQVLRASLDASIALEGFAPSSRALVTPRDYAATAIVGRTLYLMGGDSAAGRLASIEQAPIEADGTLGAFTTSSVALPAGRASARSAVVGDSIYVIGDSNAVSRATVAADGTLQPFSAAPSLTAARGTPGVAVVGRFVYVTGGATPSGPLASVERAAIQADGSLGAFANVSGVALATARQDHVIAIAGSSLYAIGGNTLTGALASVERAAINPDGTIGNFAVVPGVTLATRRYGATAAVIGSSLYVIGGHDGTTTLATIERAAIQPDGTLGPFAIVPNAALATGRHIHAGVAIGNGIHVIGGFTTAVTGSIESAVLP